MDRLENNQLGMQRLTSKSESRELWKVLSYHGCKGLWAIGGEEKKIRLSRLLHDSALELVKFSDIAHKPFDTIDKKGVRYINADTRFPCIVAEGVENPYNKRYRLCDGRHRIRKLMDQGHTEGVCYIISKKHFMEVFDRTDLDITQ